MNVHEIGIFGMSYGGYCALMAMSRYPELFASAVASAAPTDWQDYSPTFSERFMSTTDINLKGYQLAKVTSRLESVGGPVLIYYDADDSNVPPRHSIAVVETLRRLGKKYEAIGTVGRGHGEVPRRTLLDFMLRTLR